MTPVRKIQSEIIPVQAETLYRLLEFSEAILRGNYSKRILTDFNDDIITKIVDNFNRFADKMQFDPIGSYDQENTVNTFIEVISSYTNLDFKQKLPISENGTIFDAIATGINMLGDELEQSTASKQELERERNRLKEAKEYAEEANKAKSRFLANMSHEIRTPLNGILGLTQVMMGEGISEEHRKYLTMIHQSGVNLTQLINDILDLSKIESGKLQLESANFNFSKVIGSEIERHKLLAERKGLALSYHMDRSLPDEVIGDAVRISQIMTNLIGNAIKFTEEGAITINFSLAERKADEVVIQGVVQDTGIGMVAGAEEKIFQTFMQADNSVTRKFGGTGLGLSIVKNLVEQMNGKIEVRSEIGRGSAFTFTLKLKSPVKEVQANSVNGTGKEHLSFKRSLKVLIVDDNPINLLVARKMIQRFGGEVTTAENGAEAIDLTKNNAFDILLMDIQMPVLDGYEASKQLRTLNYNTPIVALSANAYSTDVQNSLNAGMNDHLQKPFTERQLFEMIEKYVA